MEAKGISADVFKSVKVMQKALRETIEDGDTVLRSTAGELGISVDTDATTRRVRSIGHADPLPTRPIRWLRSMFTPREADVAVVVDAERLAAKLRELEAKGGWPRIPGGRPIEEGATDARIPLVAERLSVTGELTSPRTGDPNVYDPVLREAVQRFQARHGLVADGILGSGTRRAMNVTVSKRIAQVELNLERWRWLPAPPEGLGDPISIALTLLVGTLVTLPSAPVICHWSPTRLRSPSMRVPSFSTIASASSVAGIESPISRQSSVRMRFAPRRTHRPGSER